jgi:hypothetical protein
MKHESAMQNVRTPVRQSSFRRELLYSPDIGREANQILVQAAAASELVPVNDSLGDGESMSILLKGIEMPTCCKACPLYSADGSGYWSCRLLWKVEDGTVVKPWKNRRKDCPLVEVPPHGRLIDADLLPWFLANEPFKCASYEDWEKLCDAICRAPTVIPATGRDIYVTTKTEEGER